jgi:uncharacterized protein YjbI with pentapeptide repeats
MMKKFGSWTGFSGKTLWDWMKLIISALIPIVLFSFGQSYSESQRISNLAIERDRQREAALQKYFDDMSELMLTGKLLESESGAQVRAITKTRTFTVLKRLDSERKGAVVQFLYDSRLIDKDNVVIFLADADLSGAYLKEANLWEANLWGANLEGANLDGADLGEAILSRAYLKDANLWGADLWGANLSGAFLESAMLMQADLGQADLGESNLSGAALWEANLEGADLTDADLRDTDVTEKQIALVRSLAGAVMPDGTVYDGSDESFGSQGEHREHSD